MTISAECFKGRRSRSLSGGRGFEDFHRRRMVNLKRNLGQRNSTNVNRERDGRAQNTQGAEKLRDRLGAITQEPS